jgi:hypothetical protein
LAHASDILRFITLWKYGGTYLDMDFVIRKWVHYHRLQKIASFPFILKMLFSRCSSVGIVIWSWIGQIVTVKFEVDLGSGLPWGKPNVRCLWPVT